VERLRQQTPPQLEAKLPRWSRRCVNITMQAVVAFALREAYVVSNRALTVDCPDGMFLFSGAQ
jgi:hypothetical protein